MHWRRKWRPTPVFLPGESQGWGSLVGCRLWGRTEADTTGVTWQQQQQYWLDQVKCLFWKQHELSDWCWLYEALGEAVSGGALKRNTELQRRAELVLGGQLPSVEALPGQLLVAIQLVPAVVLLTPTKKGELLVKLMSVHWVRLTHLDGLASPPVSFKLVTAKFPKSELMSEEDKIFWSQHWKVHQLLPS